MVESEVLDTSFLKSCMSSVNDFFLTGLAISLEKIDFSAFWCLKSDFGCKWA